MQVRAKTPHIDVQITGAGADILVDILKKLSTSLKCLLIRRHQC